MLCIFCKIIDQQLPASFIFKDELCSAFLDINPITEGHLLVVPKQHFERFTDIDDKVVSHLFRVAQKILKALEQSELKIEGANLILSDGSVAGQEVMHSHLHIIPRYKEDGQQIGFSHFNADQFPKKRLDEIAAKISRQLTTY